MIYMLRINCSTFSMAQTKNIFVENGVENKGKKSVKQMQSIVNLIFV